MKPILSFGAWSCLVAVFVAGCAHEPPEGPGGGGPGGPGKKGGPGREGPPPGGPPFLSGPIGAAWSKNTEGFVGHVEFDIQTPEGQRETLTGQLMGRDRKLLFTPEATGARGKRLKEAKVSFIWDLADRQGFMLSEALQACAPLAVSGGFTVAESPLAADAQKVDGHECHAQAVTVTAADGTITSLRVWRAADLKGVPVQVAMQPDLARPIFRLSKIHQATPPPEAFEVPEGFAKYRNPDALMAELRMRQQGMKRKPPPEGHEGEKPPPGGSPNSNPTRSY